MSKVDILLGLQWGDEGKGKVVDFLTPDYDVIARFQGGPNAGHTLFFNGTKHILHIIPSGIFHSDKVNLIGNGVLVEPYIFEKEIKSLEARGVDATSNLLISKKSHLILPTHRLLDAANEQAKGIFKIGSTLKGIGPAYTDKTARMGIRIGNIFSPNFKEIYDEHRVRHTFLAESLHFDVRNFIVDGMTLNEYEEKWLASIETLKRFNIVDSEYFLNDCLDKGMKILAEGAQGSMLDIDFGSYPYVTSSNTTSSGVCSGLGVAPSKIGKVMGISKAYCTRVGSGPFPTELFDSDGDKLRNAGNEFGSTTGRPRRCGWIDLPALKYTCMLNGVTELFITKADVLNDFDTLKICTEYDIKGTKTEQLPFELTEDITPVYTEYKGWKCELQGISDLKNVPQNLQKYLNAIESEVKVPITAVSVSPDREDIIFKR